MNNCYIEEVISIFQKNENTNNILSHQAHVVDSNNDKESQTAKIKKNLSKGKKMIKNLFNFKRKSSKNVEVDERFNNISSSSFHNNQKLGDKDNNLNVLSDQNDNNQIKMVIKNHIVFNPQLSMSSSNILNSECILLNNQNDKFIQYNSVVSEICSSNKENLEGYDCQKYV